MTPSPTAALVELSPSPELANADVALWRRDQHLAAVADLLPRIEVLSLDVFDTLLFRTCGQPEDVFLEVGRRAEAGGLLRRGLTPGSFAALRRSAQQTAYATLGREPQLEDIYAGLPAGIGPRDLLLEVEETTEADLCLLNPSIASLAAHCHQVGIPVVLLSDMYLGGRRVRALLARAGFETDQLTHQVIVSVDAGGYKKTGELYEALGDLFPRVAPGAMLHIGDNIESDVRAARAAGLHAVHYDVVRHDPDGAQALEHLACPGLIPELASLRRLAQSLCGELPEAEQTWYRAGANVVGPFVAALVDWALDQCVASGVTLIAPLMREGHLLAPLLRRAADARGHSIDVRPLHVSRQAVAVGGVRDTTHDLVGRLFDGRRHFTVADLFSVIGAPVPSEIDGHRQVLTTSAHLVETTPGTTLRGWIETHLTSETMQALLDRLVRDERQKLVGYLDRMFEGHERVATLDIGFYATIQASLDSALEQERHPVSTTHLLGFGHGPVLDHVMAGRDLRVFAGGYGDNADLVGTIHRSAPVLEQVLQGPDGSTTGYRIVERAVEPIIEDNPLPRTDLDRKASVQRGIRDYQDLWLSFRRSHPGMADGLVARGDDWCRLIHRLIDVPTHTEASSLGSLHDDLNFGTRAILPFCPATAEQLVTWTGADASYRRGTAALPAIWPQGVITRVDPAAILTRHAETVHAPYVAASVALARALRTRGVTRVVGYGTGDVALAFLDAAAMLGVEVAVLVDSHPDRHDLRLRNVPVCSLDAAMDLDIHAYVVLSVAHAGAIADVIRRRYAATSVTPLIIDTTSSIQSQ